MTEAKIWASTLLRICIHATSEPLQGIFRFISKFGKSLPHPVWTSHKGTSHTTDSILFSESIHFAVQSEARK